MRAISVAHLHTLARIRVQVLVVLLVVTAIGVALTVYFSMNLRHLERADAEKGFVTQFSMDLPGFEEFLHIRRRALRATADAVDSHRTLPMAADFATVLTRRLPRYCALCPRRSPMIVAPLLAHCCCFCT